MGKVNWRKLNRIEDGCGGEIYKILDIDNSGLLSVEIAMCVFRPGEVANLHYHKLMEEIYFVVEGEGEIELNGKLHKLKSEDAVAIPVNTKHRMRNTSKTKELRFLSINSPHWQAQDMIILPE